MRRFLTAFLAAPVLLLAACGSSETSDTATVSASTTRASVVVSTTTASTVASVETTAAATTMPPESTAPTTSAAETRVGSGLEVTEEGLLDATKIDLGGVEGVTEEQQTASEDLLRRTIEVVPKKWPTYDDAIAAGYRPDGTGSVGAYHVFHWDWINDGREFDENYPESLVYMDNPYTGEREIVNAMYMLEGDATIDNSTSVFGDIAQLHSHPNFCWQFDAEKNEGLFMPSFGDGRATCTAPATNVDTAMVHVWVRPNPCGAFAELTGVQAGQTKSGTNNCHPIHSGHSEAGQHTHADQEPTGQGFNGFEACLAEQGVDVSSLQAPGGDLPTLDPATNEAFTICSTPSTEGIFIDPNPEAGSASTTTGG